MTLWPARSEAIHCTRKRAVNSAWATRPSNTHQSNRVTKTSVRYAPIACDISTSKCDLHRLGNALLPANEPPHADKIDHADPQPIPKAAIGRAAQPRPISAPEIADLHSFAAHQRRQNGTHPIA